MYHQPHWPYLSRSNRSSAGFQSQCLSQADWDESSRSGRSSAWFSISLSYSWSKWTCGRSIIWVIAAFSASSLSSYSDSAGLFWRRVWQMCNHWQRLHHHKSHKLKCERLNREWGEGSLRTRRLYCKCKLTEAGINIFKNDIQFGLFIHTFIMS